MSTAWSGGHKWWRTYWCWRMLLTQGKCFWKIWTNRGTRMLRIYISIKGANLGLKNLDIFHWFSSPIIAAPKWSSWVYVDACGVNGWLSEWEMKILWPDPNSTNIYICSVCKDWSTSVGCDCGTSSIWYAKLILYLTDKITFPLGFLITSRDGPEKEGVNPKTLMNLWWSMGEGGSQKLPPRI